MLVVTSRKQVVPPVSFFSARSQDSPVPAPTREPLPPPPPPPQLDFALEGRSIPLQKRAPQPKEDPRSRPFPEQKTFLPLQQLQLRIDLHSEQGVEVPSRVQSAAPPTQTRQQARRQRAARAARAQSRRRQEQQKPAAEVVFQRRPRPKSHSAVRVPLAMSTMSMPAAGQKFNVADDALVFNTAEEASAVVKRLLGKTSSSVVEEHHVSTSSSSRKVSSSHQVTESARSQDFLQDSFDLLHQRHIKNLSDVIARHQLRDEEEQAVAAHAQQKQRKQVHIHQSSFYDGQLGNNGTEETGNVSPAQTFTSTKSINLSNNNSASSVSDADKSNRRCVRENSASSVQSSECSDNSNNNNYCFSNNINSSRQSNKMSEVQKSSSSTSSSSTKVQQSYSTKKQVFKQSFSSSSQEFEDHIGIDVTLTPSPTAMLINTDSMFDNRLTAMSAMGQLGQLSAGKSKVKETSKVSSSSSVCSSSSDKPEGECKQSVKSFTSKTVKKSVSDGKKVKTDVEQFSETAEEQAEGSPDKPVITFSHVSSEGSQQHFEDDIVRFDSSALSSPSRSRSPSPLLEMPAPYNDLSKEIKRPPAPGRALEPEA